MSACSSASCPENRTFLFSGLQQGTGQGQKRSYVDVFLFFLNLARGKLEDGADDTKASVGGVSEVMREDRCECLSVVVDIS